MFESPRSLTAVIHVRFHYKEADGKGGSEGGVALMDKILEQASELPPELQEVVVKFADYLNGLKNDGQNPGEN